MQSLNVLIAGEGKLLDLVRGSKFLKKLFITSSEEVEGVVSIKFNTFKELAQKCKSLQIDIVLVENENWVRQGIADVLRAHFVNCVAPTALWSERLVDSIESRNLLEKYNIAVPEKLKYPQKFPLLIRGKGFKYRAESLEEVLQIKRAINQKYSQEIAQGIFLEDFLEGEIINLTSFYDGKNVKTFSDRYGIAEYSEALKEMLTKEKADFIGFFVSRIILHNGKYYNAGFGLDFSKTEFDKDFLFILSYGIYQKINELD